MRHVVLLGDSIFDNAAYVPGGPDVIRQLRERLSAGWRATLAAVDGAVARDVAAQLRRLPEDATHLVVSAGGNDALSNLDVLSRPARSSADGIWLLGEVSATFERTYREMLGAVLSRGLPTTLCTIYDPRFPDAREQRLAQTGLMVFNDVILRVAFERGLPVLDLRLICDEDADYANPIEPSVRGGAKIADSIARLLAGEGERASTVLAGRDGARGAG
jgi:lysophospholipase L1-like esterase